MKNQNNCIMFGRHHKYLLVCLSCEIDANPHFAERKTEAQI